MVCNSGNIISKGSPKQVGKLQKFLGVGRSDKKPREGKFQGVEGSEAKVPPSAGGGMDIFLNYTMHFAHS